MSHSALNTFAKWRELKKDEQKVHAELIAQGWHPTEKKSDQSMNTEEIQDARVVLIFKFLAAVKASTLHLTALDIKKCVEILEDFAKNLVFRATNFFQLYCKIIK